MDVLTGFVNADGEALGRPVGVAIDRAGALLVADDVGNVIWREDPHPRRRPWETDLGAGVAARTVDVVAAGLARP